MLGFVLIVIAILVVFGMAEKRLHQKRVNTIPLRINVNGTRGKSTVTRLITALLTESGVRVVGKTTGSTARLIYWSGEEKEILRKPEGPNIREQKGIVKEVAGLKAEALVSECMALNPDYQVVFQEHFLQANIGVITNVLPDHMDIMGPTLDHVAESFRATIPYNGYLVLTPGKYLDFFKQEAMKRNTEVVLADPALVSNQYLAQFNYVLFPENVAIALAVAKLLDIKEEQALRGMLKAKPDLGALRVIETGNLLHPTYFINAFAANDPKSTVSIAKHMQEQGYNVEHCMIIMNCRGDRVQRSLQFVQEVLPKLKITSLVLIGEKTGPVIKAYKAKKFQAQELINLEKKSSGEIYKVLEEKLPGRTVLCIGNIQGSGEELIRYIERLKSHIFSEKVS